VVSNWPHPTRFSLQRWALYTSRFSRQVSGLYYPIAGGNVYAFVYSDGQYTTIIPPGCVYALGLGINKSGQIAGIYCTVTNHGFLADPVGQ
jgi:hypothetical protein